MKASVTLSVDEETCSQPETSYFHLRVQKAAVALGQEQEPRARLTYSGSTLNLPSE